MQENVYEFLHVKSPTFYPDLLYVNKIMKLGNTEDPVDGHIDRLVQVRLNSSG